MERPMDSYDQAAVCLSSTICHAPQRELIAKALEREGARVLRVAANGHVMIIRLDQGKAYLDEQTDTMVKQRELSIAQLRILTNALRTRLGQEPLPYR